MQTLIIRSFIKCVIFPISINTKPAKACLALWLLRKICNSNTFDIIVLLFYNGLSDNIYFITTILKSSHKTDIIMYQFIKNNTSKVIKFNLHKIKIQLLLHNRGLWKI